MIFFFFPSTSRYSLWNCDCTLGSCQINCLELGASCQGHIPPLLSFFLHFFFFVSFFFHCIGDLSQWHFDLHINVQSQSTDSCQMLILLSRFPLRMKRQDTGTKRVSSLHKNPPVSNSKTLNSQTPKQFKTRAGPGGIWLFKYLRLILIRTFFHSSNSDTWLIFWGTRALKEEKHI